MKYLLFKPLDPLLGTIFDAASSFGLQQAAQSSNVQSSKRLMDYQSQLQRRNQEMMMAKQYPLQVGSMIAAGLNPATANGLSSPVSSPMPSASANTPSSPYNSNLAANILASKQAQQSEANIDLTKSQANYYDTLAKKTGTEEELLNYDMMTYFERFETEMRKTFFEGSRAESGTALDFERVNEVKQNVINLKKAVDKMESEILVNKATASFTDVQRNLYDDKIKAEIALAFANAKYLSNEDKRQGQQLYSKIFMMNSQGSMFRSQSSFNQANKALLEWNTKIAKRYDDARAITGMTAQLLNSASNLIDSFVPF